MTAPADHDLLATYARTGDEPAFAALVARHINLVHSAARRFAGNDAAAAEITQAVFLILARKAGSLRRGTPLAGWLYQTARLTAANLAKADFRRQQREQEAYMQSQLNEADAAVWRQIGPLLDHAMGKLGAADRAVLVLRFFENQTNAEAAAALGLAEGAVQKRAHRALEKLRKIFAKQGVIHTAQAIAGTVTANAVVAAPAGLALKIAALAAQGAVVSTSLAALVKGTLKVMAWIKMKTVVVVASGFIMATGISVVIVETAKPSIIQGKTENEWIKSIVYFGDDNQTKLWLSIGPQGIQMLVRALKSPTYDHSTRMCVASLLNQLGNEAKSAIPEIIELIKAEKDDSVRAIELGYFEGPIEHMTAEEKNALFPELLRAMQSGDSGVRNNALVALQYYPDQSDTVIPLMVKSLQDSVPQVRLMAVRSLNKVDPQNAANSDFVPVLVGCLGDASGAANEAVIMLGELHRDRNLAVPALIQSLQSAEVYVRQNSAVALGKFGNQAKTAIPALTQALGDSDANVRSQAAAALKRITAGALAN